MATKTDDGRVAIMAGLSRRRRLKGSGAALTALGLIGAAGFGNALVVRADEREQSRTGDNAATKPNIVLVHGAWADGSSWSRVIQRLQEARYSVTAPQFPLTSLAANLARLREVLAVQSDPTIVVGHSYGGQIITALGADAPNSPGWCTSRRLGLTQVNRLESCLGRGHPLLR